MKGYPRLFLINSSPNREVSDLPHPSQPLPSVSFSLLLSLLLCPTTLLLSPPTPVLDPRI